MKTITVNIELTKKYGLYFSLILSYLVQISKVKGNSTFIIMNDKLKEDLGLSVFQIRKEVKIMMKMNLIKKRATNINEFTLNINEIENLNKNI